MFFSVIAAYVIAAAFAFCGVVGVFNYIAGFDRHAADYPTFLAGLAVSLWPLAVAIAIVMLVQVACLVERWILLWQMGQGSAPVGGAAAPAARKKPAAAESVKKPEPREESAPTYFACEDIAPAVKPPVMRDEPKPAPAPKAEVPAEAEDAAPAEAAPAPKAEEPAPAPVPAPKKDEGLSFFKLD